MFTAIILMCHIAFPDDCVVFQDALEPSKTIEQCKERGYEMAEKISGGLPLVLRGMKCEKVGTAI